jgi:glycolate oxidase iron-sulfur subunit
MRGAGNCGKCGICLAVCPVYAVLQEEQNSPRARIQLIKAVKNKKLPSSPLLKELIAKCLMCGSCAANCPSGVDHYAQFMEMRSQLIKEHGDRLEIRGLVYLLAKEQRLRLAMGAARMGQAVIPSAFQKKYRLGNIPVKNYPKLNTQPFRSEVAEELAPRGEERGTVLYFTGCGTNYIFGETGHAALKILSRLGYRVIIPSKQTCCSIPMLFHGGVEEARENIVANIACFQDERACAILVDCPTCGSALRDEFPELMRKYGLDDTAAKKIAAKTRDMTAFIAEHLDQLTFRQAEAAPIRVGYHLPCHLKNAAGSSEPLLRQIPAIDYVELVNRGDCCGGGGTFFYEYPELSGRIAAAKIASIRASGAQIWLTDCPVCRINLAGQLAEEDGITMMHPLTLLAGLLAEPDGPSQPTGVS